jgi:hypothetical protein
MFRASYKVEVVEYRLEGGITRNSTGVTVYKIVEKHYFLGIRLYKEEHKAVLRDLEYAKKIAEKVSARIHKEYSRDVLSKKPVHTIKG